MSKVTEYLRGHLLGEVSVRQEDRKLASGDNGVLQQMPEMVVYPFNTNDIRKIVRFSWQLAEKGHIMPLSARGSGQDTSGGSLTKGVVIDLSRHMTRVYEYDSKQKLVRLQPGVINDTLNEALTLQGAAVMSFLGSPMATAGGSVANYTAGPYAGKYGSIAGAVDKLEIILSNGDVLQTGRISKRELEKKKGLQGLEGDIYRGIDALIEDNEKVIANIAPEDSSGYGGIAFVKEKNGSFDLTPLFIGSQGSLGIISEMILRSDFRSLHVDVIAMTFDDAGKAYDCIDDLEKLNPMYVEYYDARLFEAALKVGESYPFYKQSDAKAQAVLLVGFDDFGDRTRERNVKKAKKIAEKYGASFDAGRGVKALEYDAARDVTRYTAAPDQSTLESPDIYGRFFVPKLKFDSFTKGLAELESKLHIDLPLSGWALAGSYSVHPVLALSKTADKQKMLKLLDELAKLITAHGGQFITDGGEGKLKVKFAEQSRDPDETKLYEEIKQICDPHGILAPGVKVKSDLRAVVALLK